MQVDLVCNVEFANSVMSGLGTLTTDATMIEADHHDHWETVQDCFSWLQQATLRLIFNQTMGPVFSAVWAVVSTVLIATWAALVENIRDALRCLGL
jgi:hypothetical protein